MRMLWFWSGFEYSFDKYNTPTPKPILFRNWYGTPLSNAAHNGAFLICKLLLEQGADVNEVCGDGNKDRPLTIAAGNGHIEIVRLFLDANAALDVEGTNYPLATAASQGHDAVIQLLAEAGACINPPERTSRFSVPLFQAVWYGKLTTVETLLRLGADVTWKNFDGETALHSAVCSNHQDCQELSREECAKKLIQIFLDEGLDINAISWNSGTPLTAAVSVNGEIEVKILLERGADARIKTSRYGEPLEAVRRKHHSWKSDKYPSGLERSRRIKKILKDHLKAKGEEVEDSDSDYDEPGKWWEELGDRD